MQVLVPGRQADARPLHASAARFAHVSTYALRTDSQVQSAGFLSKPGDVANLVAYVLSIDEDTAPLPLPASPGAEGGDFCAAP